MKTLLQLFWAFFKIGAFTFGSGYAMIPMIEKEVVDKRKWFEKDDFYDQFALASSAPGPFSLNTAVFVGYKMAGWWGAFFAVLGAVLPSFVIILVIAIYLTEFSDNRYVVAAFKGIRPAVIALIAVPFINMLKRLPWYFMLLGIAVALVICYLGVSPVWFILGGAIIGVVLSWYEKPKTDEKGGTK